MEDVSIVHLFMYSESSSIEKTLQLTTFGLQLAQVGGRTRGQSGGMSEGQVS